MSNMVVIGVGGMLIDALAPNGLSTQAQVFWFVVCLVAVVTDMVRVLSWLRSSRFGIGNTSTRGNRCIF